MKPTKIVHFHIIHPITLDKRHKVPLSLLPVSLKDLGKLVLVKNAVLKLLLLIILSIK